MTRGGKRGSRLLRIALLLLGILLAAEVGVRIYTRVERAGPTAAAPAIVLSRSDILLPSRHQDLIYELKPGIRGTLGGRLLHTNAFGLRGRERRLEKPQGTYRIAGLGDAHMFGLGVAEGQTYLDLLERRLNAGAGGGRRYEALNFAAPGFNTVQEVAMFEHRAVRFEPDLVLIHFVNDDFRLPEYLSAPSAPPRPSSYLLDLVSTRSSRAAGNEPARAALVRSSEASEGLLEELSDREYAVGRDGAGRSLERLARIADERSIPVIFMVLGESGPARSAARDLATEIGFHYLDALPAFHEQMVTGGLELTRDAWKRAFFLSRDQPTAVAHRVWANVLFRKLVELELTALPAEGS